MGLWPFSKRAKQSLIDLRDVGEPSDSLDAALVGAAEYPLDDHTTRVVVAFPEDHHVIDVTIFQLDALFTAYEKEGLKKARAAGAEVLSAIVNGKPIEGNTIGGIALAYFDVVFTVAANKGKNHATAWNTLTLDVWREDARLVAVRGARRIDYPTGPLDLSLDPLRLFR
jgi:hypothetical protein